MTLAAVTRWAETAYVVVFTHTANISRDFALGGYDGLVERSGN